MAVEWAAYFKDLCGLVRLALPIVLGQTIYSVMFPATLAFCGTLGREKLSAVGLAISLFQLVVVSCAAGIRWGCAPLFAQSYGSKNRVKMGIYLQRSMCCAIILSIICCCFCINSGNILILTGQIPELAFMAEQYLMLLMPGCVGLIIFRVLLAYTDTLRVVWPTFISYILGSLTNLALQYVFINHTTFGFHGSAIALSISLLMLPFLQFIVILAKKLHVGTWSGWSLKAFTGWMEFYRVMIPSLMLTILGIFGTEIGNFVAGTLGTEYLAAQSVLFQINTIALMMAIGAGAASVSMIGQQLGANNPNEARRVYIINTIFLSGLGIVTALVIYSLKDVLPSIFSFDTRTKEVFLDLVPYLCVYNGFNVASYSSLAGLRACNYHIHCVFINIISYYVLSIPLGFSLTFIGGLYMHGIWIGFVAAVITSCILSILYMSRVKWSDKANSIAEKQNLDTDFEMSISKSVPVGDNENEALLKEKKKRSVEKRRLTLREAAKQKLGLLSILIVVLALSIIIRIAVPPITSNNSTKNGMLNVSSIDYLPQI